MIEIVGLDTTHIYRFVESTFGLGMVFIGLLGSSGLHNTGVVYPMSKTFFNPTMTHMLIFGTHVAQVTLTISSRDSGVTKTKCFASDTKYMFSKA